MTLHEKIYAYRKQLNLSQEALADKLNVSRQAVSKWESGQAKPDIDNLIVMTQLFNITLDELMTDKAPQASDISVHLIHQRKQLVRLGLWTLGGMMVTFGIIGAVVVSLLLGQLAEVRQLAQSQINGYQSSIGSLQAQIAQLVYSINQQETMDTDLITDYQARVTDLDLADQTLTYTLSFLVKDETGLESIQFTQLAGEQAIVTEAKPVGLGAYTVVLVLDMNQDAYAVSARFNYTDSQKNQSFGQFSGYHILHPDFKINIGADATETSMVLRYIGLVADQLACINGKIVLDIPLRLVVRNERQSIVYTLPIDLQKANPNKDVCMTGSTLTSVFIEYTDLSKRLQANQIYTFEISSPPEDPRDPEGATDLLIVVGTFEYRDNQFTSTGNVN